MSKYGRVLVVMSGGIDSMVMVMMMYDMGYEVVGIIMKIWDYVNFGGFFKEMGCCSLDFINDVWEVVVKVGFYYFIIDICDEFGDYVIDNFVDEYLVGCIFNFCVFCNIYIKWSVLLKWVDVLDCEFIVIGYYV